MFVGCVVAGSVMLCGSGAAVRGALIRDVSAYAIAASAVALLLHSGQVCHARLHCLLASIAAGDVEAGLCNRARPMQKLPEQRLCYCIVTSKVRSSCCMNA